MAKALSHAEWLEQWQAAKQRRDDALAAAVDNDPGPIREFRDAETGEVIRMPSNPNYGQYLEGDAGYPAVERAKLAWAAAKEELLAIEPPLEEAPTDG